MLYRRCDYPRHTPVIQLFLGLGIMAFFIVVAALSDKEPSPAEKLMDSWDEK